MHEQSIEKLIFGRELALASLKQALCEQLVLPLVRIKESRRATPEICYQRPNVDDVVGSIDSSHYESKVKCKR